MPADTQTRDMLSPGDRAPNVFLPDQRDVVISLYDKSCGGPIFVLLYPTQEDRDCAGELQRLFALAPRMLAGGAHLFAIGGDPVPLVQQLAVRHDPGFFLLADDEQKAAAAFGARGKLVGFVLDPNQRVRRVLPPGDTPIAERALANLAALRPPPPSRPGIHPPLLVIPDALPSDFCRYLIAQFNARGHEASGVFRTVEGRMVHAENIDIKQRRDHYVVDQDLLQALGGYMKRRVLPEIHRAFHCPIEYIEEFKIVRYDADVGGYFRPHRDNTAPGTAHRRFAMTLNLNAEDYDGGELCFPEYANATYKPATGEAVVFSCNLLHEATDVTAGQRYVLLSFMYDEGGRKLRERYLKAMQQRQA